MNEEIMSWNFRITKELRTHKDGRYDPKIMYGIRDVFVDENGDIVNIGSKLYILLENVDNIKLALQKMLLACDKPAIDYLTGE